jgi:hypothetical protein
MAQQLSAQECSSAVTGWNAIPLTNSFNYRLEPVQFQAVSPVPIDAAEPELKLPSG